MAKYSWQRLYAVIAKEFIQMLRDKGTLAMIIALPLMQIILFGYAINTNPHNLPTAVVASDYSVYTRDFLKGLENSDYFKVVATVKSEQEAERLIATGKVLFIVNFPPNFTRDLIRGQKPALLVEADASDPSATGNALAALSAIAQNVFSYDLKGSLSYVNNSSGQNINQANLNPQFSAGSPIDLRIHARYNPSQITQLNIVPGLMGVILTMTMVMITAVAVTRERERGTMENLLATPIQPLEVMVGKVLPYIIVGYIQASLILFAAAVLFAVPVKGSILLLIAMVMPFIAANLIVGLTMSTVAKNQLQSVQMTTFFFLPSILLSGFMFPFSGMPTWAQWIGQVLPLTHFLRITRGILLKGNGWLEIWPDVWPILVFLLAVMILGVKRYRKTLD